MKHKFVIVALLLLVGAILVNSCVDQSYDLGNVDDTISFGGEAFVFPLGSTDTLRLIDFLSEEDVEFLKVAEDGSYRIELADAIDLSDQIPDLSGALHFEDLTVEEAMSIDWTDFVESSPAPVRMTDGEFMDFHLRLGPVNIPREIEQLACIYMNDATFNLKVELPEIPGITADYRLELDVEVPEEFLSEDARLSEDHILSINAYLENNTLTVDPLKITGFDLSEIELVSPFVLDKTIRVRTRLYAENVVVDHSQYAARPMASTPIEVKVIMDMKDLAVSKVVGKLDYAFGYNMEVNFLEVPAFMMDENFVMDLSNPHFLLDMTSNLGIAMDASVDLVAIRNGQEDETSKISLNLGLPYTPDPDQPSTTHYWIGGNEQDVPEGYQFVQQDFSSLFKKLPESFRMHVKGETDTSKDHILVPDADYQLEVGYQFVLPLSFGPDLHIAMADTLTGMPSILGKILEMGTLKFVGEVANTLPLQVDMHLELLDEQGRIIATDGAVMQQVAACHPDGSPGMTQLDLQVKLAPGASAEALSSLRVSFQVTSPDLSAVVLEEKDFIRASLAIAVPGGLTGTIDQWGNLL